MYSVNTMRELTPSDVQVIFCDGAETPFQMLVEHLGFRKANIHFDAGLIQRCGIDRAIPTILQIEQSKVFARNPHAFLTVIKNLRHSEELTGLPVDVLRHVAPIVYNDTQGLDRVMTELMAKGARPVGTTSIEMTGMPLDIHHPLTQAILGAAQF